MAYDRNPPRTSQNYGRDPESRRAESRWAEDRYDDRDRDRDWGRGSRRDERGFFDRAGDEVASWFGDDEAERRRRDDHMRDSAYGSGYRGYGRDRADYGRGAYRPARDDFTRSDQFYAASGVPRGGWGMEDRNRFDRLSATYGRDEHRRSSDLGRSRDFDPHYQSWRDRQIEDLDRDYREYRQENQARFENDFANWRQQRIAKRDLLARVSEHMEVVGNDDEHVGTVDKVGRDRIVLTKSDPDSGGTHHSLSCSAIDRVEGDRVILDYSAAEAKRRWHDEGPSRPLFERDDQGETGPRILDRSFEGTYR